MKFVMDFYDPELSQLVIPERGKIPVDIDSVERIWGLPRGRNKVAYEIDPDIVKFFNEMFNIPSGACTNSDQVGGDDKGDGSCS